MKKVLKAIRENRLEKEAVLHGGGQGKLCWEGGFEQKLKHRCIGPMVFFAFENWKKTINRA